MAFNPLFGRLVPSDDRHIVSYPFNRLSFGPVSPSLEITIDVPPYYDIYDQGAHGACVGFSLSWMMSLYNRAMYNALELYWWTQDVDGDPDTTREANNGTYVRSGFDVLKTVGHWKISNGATYPPSLSEGITSYYWIQTVNEGRIAMSLRRPVVLGVNWYEGFMKPKDGWIGKRSLCGWGKVLGGHAVCMCGCSDSREAFLLLHTWGVDYPSVTWLPYRALERLLHEDGEAGVAIDTV